MRATARGSSMQQETARAAGEVVHSRWRPRRGFPTGQVIAQSHQPAPGRAGRSRPMARYATKAPLTQPR